MVVVIPQQVTGYGDAKIRVTFRLLQDGVTKLVVVHFGALCVCESHGITFFRIVTNLPFVLPVDQSIEVIL